jgi:hypothetical protein
MAKRLKHRIPRLFRAATVITWAIQGLFAPWLQVPVYAANPDTIHLGVTPISTAPPAAITDLLGSTNLSASGQISLSWTAPQGNQGGIPIPNQTVASYEVHYATYGVDSLTGNTTSWWNGTMASSTTLQPPGYTPQPPGSPEAYTFTGLTPGVTYYFGIKSTSQGGVISMIDTESSTFGQQAHAIASQLLTAPTNFAGVATSTGSIFWSWNAVTGATSYQVFSDPANIQLQSVLAPTTSWSETGLSINTAYSRKVQASDSTSSSGFSNIVTRYTQAQAPLNLSTTSVTSTSVSLSWNANNNPAGTSFDVERSQDGLSFSQILTTTNSTAQDTGLSPSTTYYYRVRAFNGDNVVTAYTSILSASTNPPAMTSPLAPNGLLSTISGSQATLSWSPVTLDTQGNAVTIDHYVLQRYQAIDSTPTLTVNVTGATNYTDNTFGADYFYTIQAVSTNGSVSALSDYLDAQGNRYALAADDPSTRVVMPHDAALYLVKGNNPYGDDIEILLTHQPQDEVNVTLRSYLISARTVSTQQTLTPFSFPLSDVSVQLGFGAAVGSLHLSVSQRAAVTSGSIAQIISVYWFNGSTYVQIGDPVLTSGQSIGVDVRNLGTYQLRAVTLGSHFQLTQGSPYPRVITPNGAENRRVFFFFDNPMGDSVTGAIYDVRGAKVRDLQINSQSPTPNCLVWDGKDNQGSVVHSGVFLYKISTGQDTVTGTVVVAR